jgi:hypothetical protein
LLVTIATFVIDLKSRLRNDQAAVNRIDINAFSLTRRGPRKQCVVVHLEIVTKQRQSKPAATLERSVTRSPVATQSAQQWHDVLLEIGRLGDLRIAKTLVDGQTILTSKGPSNRENNR